MELKLQEKRLVAEDAVQLRFASNKGTALPKVQAGAQIDIFLQNFSVNIRWCYHRMNLVRTTCKYLTYNRNVARRIGV